MQCFVVMVFWWDFICTVESVSSTQIWGMVILHVINQVCDMCFAITMYQMGNNNACADSNMQYLTYFSIFFFAWYRVVSGTMVLLSENGGFVRGLSQFCVESVLYESISKDTSYAIKILHIHTVLQSFPQVIIQSICLVENGVHGVSLSTTFGKLVVVFILCSLVSIITHYVIQDKTAYDKAWQNGNCGSIKCFFRIFWRFCDVSQRVLAIVLANHWIGWKYIVVVCIFETAIFLNAFASCSKELSLRAFYYQVKVVDLNFILWCFAICAEYLYLNGLLQSQSNLFVHQIPKKLVYGYKLETCLLWCVAFCNMGCSLVGFFYIIKQIRCHLKYLKLFF